VTYTDMELSKLLKVNRSTIFRWRTECNMPVDDLDLARAFAANRKPATKRAPKVEVDPVPVTGESVYDVRDRLHKEERSIAAEVAGLNVALEQARTLNDEKGAFKLLQALKSTREDHRRQVDALLKSEARILLLEKSRGSLVDTDVCKSFISQCLVPTIIWMRKLADAARNPEERALLESLRDAGLLTINASAKEAANFNAKALAP
jgi:hypothetical protein